MRRTLIWTLAGVIAVIAIAPLLVRSTSGATASTLGRGPLGWRGLARVLEGRGVEVSRLDRPLVHHDPSTEGATLFVAFPWQRASPLWDPAPVVGFVHRGGRLVLATSGGSPSLSERTLLRALGVTWARRPSAPPLRPLRWWRERRRGASWPAGSAARWRHPLRTGVLGAVARPPARPESSPTPVAVLAIDEEGRAIASVFAAGGGEVWLLPSQVLANAHLGEPGNAALALALASVLGERVVFDEYHHGLVGRGAGADEPATRSLDAVVLQLVLLWVLALLALAWRFGPSWPAPSSPADAHRAFLVGLGALHRRLGHDRDAARALVRRVSAYAPALLPAERVERALQRAEAVPLLQLARELSRPGGPPGKRRTPS